MFQKTFFFAVDGIGDCAIGVHFPEPKKKERKKNTRSNDHPTRVKTTFQPEKRRDIEFHCNGLGAGTERTQFHSKFNEYFCCKRLPDVFPRLNPTNEWKVSMICIDFVPKCIHESSCLAFFFRSFIERERERKQLNGNN